MKKCPYCANDIQEAAVKCQYCGEFLGARPASSNPGPAPRSSLDGDLSGVQQPQTRTSGGGRAAVVIVIVLFVLLFFIGIVAMVYFRLGNAPPPSSPPVAQTSDFPPIPDYAPSDSAPYPPPPVVDDGPPSVVREMPEEEAPPPPLVPNARVAPRGSPGGWVTPDDYPAVALREGREGTTSFSLTVGPDGRAQDCQITRSSGSADLDNATCRLMRSRARFYPATNAASEPTVGIYSNRIRWTMP